MNTYTKEEFVDFCRTKGSEEYVSISVSQCAVTQFFRSKHPEVRRSRFGRDENTQIGKIADGTGVCSMNLTYEEENVVLRAWRFDQIVTYFEKGIEECVD